MGSAVLLSSGAQGPAGSQGPMGPQGPAGISGGSGSLVKSRYVENNVTTSNYTGLSIDYTPDDPDNILIIDVSINIATNMFYQNQPVIPGDWTEAGIWGWWFADGYNTYNLLKLYKDDTIIDDFMIQAYHEISSWSNEYSNYYNIIIRNDPKVITRTICTAGTQSTYSMDVISVSPEWLLWENAYIVNPIGSSSGYDSLTGFWNYSSNPGKSSMIISEYLP